MRAELCWGRAGADYKERPKKPLELQASTGSRDGLQDRGITDGPGPAGSGSESPGVSQRSQRRHRGYLPMNIHPPRILSRICRKVRSCTNFWNNKVSICGGPSTDEASALARQVLENDEPRQRPRYWAAPLGCYATSILYDTIHTALYYTVLYIP